MFFGLLLALAVSGEGAGFQNGEVHRVAVAQAETLHVTVYGRGDDVVIVPGIWSMTYAFRKVVPLLTARGFRVTVIEPLGVASSSGPRHADYSLGAQGARVGAALDSLGIRRAIFAGQALGTSMLLHMEVETPGRIAGLVSIEGGAGKSVATPGLKRGLSIAAIVFRVFPSRALLRRRLRGTMENVSAEKSWITPEVVAAYAAPWTGRISATLETYREMAKSGEKRHLTAHLGSIRVPVDLLLGAAPHYGGPDTEGTEALARLSRTRITRIPKAGHLLHEERPDAVADAIVRMRTETLRR